MIAIACSKQTLLDIMCMGIVKYYYYFVIYRSVRNVIDQNGEILNTYDYDPFGKVLQKSERVRNVHQYLGGVGAMKHDELSDMYFLRDRVYDASHGRYISVDPMG